VATAKILLIDDDVDLLDMLKTYLEREQLAVTARAGSLPQCSHVRRDAVFKILSPQRERRRWKCARHRARR
jgi:DNA-binding response OmpR family regulator